jgi:hypothetical protein
VEGPLHELREFREQVVVELGDHVHVSAIREPVDSIFDPGRLGDSPVVTFLIEYAAQLAAGGTVGVAVAIKNLIQRRGASRIKMRELSPEVLPDVSNDANEPGGGSDVDRSL